MTIEKVISDYHNQLPDAVIYVYDNNSSDSTDKIAKSAGAVVRYEYQQGKGNVIRRMFREIDALCYLMTDGDDTYPADTAQDMTRLVLEKHVDMVVGDRLSSTYFSENKRMFHNFGNMLMQRTINLLFHSNIKDIMTGCRAFSYEFAKSFPVLSSGFEIETEMSIHAIDKNMFVENVVVGYRDRPDGSVSKLSTFSDGAKVIRTMLSLFKNYRPFPFFGIIALVLILLSIGVFIPTVLIEYLKTGLVLKFPTLIVCSFIFLAGLLSLCNGMILATVVNSDRRNFEFKLQMVDMNKKRLLEKEKGE